MTIYIPEWVVALVIGLASLYLFAGIVLYPVIITKVHRSMQHNAGWTWRTTFFGRRFNLFRFAFGHLLMILLWPWALKEAF